MIHLLEDIHFTLKPLYIFRVIHFLFFDEFDCSFKPWYLVDAPANFAVGALTELLFDLIGVCDRVQLFFDEI